VIVGSAYDEAVERLRSAVESLVVGPPDDPATYVPPVIGRDAKAKIEGYIAAARGYATLLAQGAAPGGDGSYVRPAVFTDVPVDSPLAQEEVFGPVLAVFRAATFDEALAIAMNSRYALTGGVFSRNPRHVALARRRFAVGSLYINRRITGAIMGRHPFGGSALSGIGEKAGGPDYVRQFMERCDGASRPKKTSPLRYKAYLAVFPVFTFFQPACNGSRSAPSYLSGTPETLSQEQI
jgi:RHH-type proline utilization regulon transcriptional repressor/proline dehydrogenase/delta 1-pyrroline-5-carboxylate dehydrogenase